MNKLSTERIALVPKSKGLTFIDIDMKEVAEIKELADYILTTEEFVRNVRTGHPYNLDAFIPVTIDETPDRIEVGVDMNEDDFDIVINGKWELHVRANEGNLSVDAYHVFDSEDEDHDYDEDFISGLGWLSADDLARDEDED